MNYIDKANYIVLKIVIDRGDKYLHVYECDRRTFSYPVSVGNENIGKRTPAGRFVVINKVKNPVTIWRSGKIITSNDLKSTYGARWIGLARYTDKEYKGLGIHGTNVESSIGKQITLGSIQMLNRDIIELFDRVKLETEVIIQ